MKYLTLPFTVTFSSNEDSKSHLGGMPPLKVFPTEKEGLYDPAYEKDACGVGMILALSAEPEHQIVRDGIELLERMAHRGATGADEGSG